MKLILKLLLCLFPLFALTACDRAGESAQPVTPKGPALIMFYTDN